MRKICIMSALALAVLPHQSIADTTDQWRQRKPRWETTSSHTLAELQGCLGSHWAGTLSAQMLMLPIKNGISYTNNGMNRDIMVDVVDEGDQRRIKLWLRKFFGITAGAKEQIEKLSYCAAQP